MFDFSTFSRNVLEQAARPPPTLARLDDEKDSTLRLKIELARLELAKSNPAAFAMLIELERAKLAAADPAAILQHELDMVKLKLQQLAATDPAIRQHERDMARQQVELARLNPELVRQQVELIKAQNQQDDSQFSSLEVPIASATIFRNSRVRVRLLIFPRALLYSPLARLFVCAMWQWLSSACFTCLPFCASISGRTVFPTTPSPRTPCGLPASPACRLESCARAPWPSSTESANAASPRPWRMPASAFSFL